VAPAPRRNPLRHVLWLGGISGVGKTSAALEFSRRYDVRLFSAGQAFTDHGELLREAQMLEHLSGASATDLAAAYEELARHRFRVAVERLRELPTDVPVLAEGRFLLPDLVAPLAAGPQHVLFLVAAEATQRRTLASRRREKSAAAAQARFVLDQALADRIRADARARGLPVVEARDPRDTFRLVESQFLPLIRASLESPKRGDRARRRREMNDERLRYVRGRMHASALTGNPVLRLRCECDGDCSERIDVTVDDAESARARSQALLAPSHAAPR
jgi:hypothetical protein